jgi:hypothetical protein
MSGPKNGETWQLHGGVRKPSAGSLSWVRIWRLPNSRHARYQTECGPPRRQACDFAIPERRLQHHSTIQLWRVTENRKIASLTPIWFLVTKAGAKNLVSRHESWCQKGESHGVAQKKGNYTNTK